MGCTTRAVGYSHTAAIPIGPELILLSGQYGPNAEGGVVSPDFAAQAKPAFSNLRGGLTAQGLNLSHVAQLRTYVVNPEVDKLFDAADCRRDDG